MNLQAVGSGIEVDDRIREVLDLKLAKELEKYLHDFADDLKHAHIKIEKLARGGFSVNFNMKLPGNNGHIFSEVTGDDLTNVIIALRHEVERQLRDYKSKLQDYK